jgi:hypothetical protein
MVGLTVHCNNFGLPKFGCELGNFFPCTCPLEIHDESHSHSSLGNPLKRPAAHPEVYLNGVSIADGLRRRQRTHGKMAAATLGSRMDGRMQDAPWWNDLLATIDGKRAQDFARYLTHDGEFRFGNQPSVHGQGNVAAYVDAFFGMIGGSRHELARTWRDDGTRVCEGRVTYTRLDGSTLTVPFANVFYMRDDQIARYLIFIDNTALFAPA